MKKIDWELVAQRVVECVIIVVVLTLVFACAHQPLQRLLDYILHQFGFAGSGT